MSHAAFKLVEIFSQFMSLLWNYISWTNQLLRQSLKWWKDTIWLYPSALREFDWIIICMIINVMSYLLFGIMRIRLHYLDNFITFIIYYSSFTRWMHSYAFIIALWPCYTRSLLCCCNHELDWPVMLIGNPLFWYLYYTLHLFSNANWSSSCLRWFSCYYNWCSRDSGWAYWHCGWLISLYIILTNLLYSKIVYIFLCWLSSPIFRIE